MKGKKINRYVFKINDSTYVTDIDWIAMQIPTIKTGFFDNAAIYTDDYLNDIVIKDGTTRKDILLKFFPNIKILPIKIVIDEQSNENE